MLIHFMTGNALDKNQLAVLANDAAFAKAVSETLPVILFTLAIAAVLLVGPLIAVLKFVTKPRKTDELDETK